MPTHSMREPGQARQGTMQHRRNLRARTARVLLCLQTASSCSAPKFRSEAAEDKSDSWLAISVLNWSWREVNCVARVLSRPAVPSVRSCRALGDATHAASDPTRSGSSTCEQSRVDEGLERRSRRRRRAAAGRGRRLCERGTHADGRNQWRSARGNCPAARRRLHAQTHVCSARM